MALPKNEHTTETTPKTRVETELKELSEKIGKLSEFVYGKMRTANLSKGMCFLLNRQLEDMIHYAKILACRLEIWGKAEEDIDAETRTIIRHLLEEF